MSTSGTMIFREAILGAVDYEYKTPEELLRRCKEMYPDMAFPMISIFVGILRNMADNDEIERGPQGRFGQVIFPKHWDRGKPHSRPVGYYYGTYKENKDVCCPVEER